MRISLSRFNTRDNSSEVNKFSFPKKNFTAKFLLVKRMTSLWHTGHLFKS